MSPASSCPDENELSAWALGSAPPTTHVATHLETCAPCRAAVGAVVQAARLGASITRPGGLGARLVPVESSAVEVGQVLVGKYEVLERLGSGGMGVVFRAKHLQLNTEVALKFIRTELASNPDVATRFAREARAASRLKSLHANRVLDLERLSDGRPFMVLEYVVGETLHSKLRREGPLPEGDVVQWMRQALEALGEAHQLGIVHRDLKPENLFLRRGPSGEEAVVVLDFGVAKSVNPDIELGLKQTSLQAVVGSPLYMAPEQLTPGASVDARVDIWALGCTMHVLLCGEPPFQGADFIDLAWQIRNAEPASVSSAVSPGLRACIRRCLLRDPGARFPSAQALLEALTALEVASPLRMQWKGLVAVGLATVGLAVGWALTPTSAPPAAPLRIDVPAVKGPAEPLPMVAATEKVDAGVAPVLAAPRPVVRRVVRDASVPTTAVELAVDAGTDEVFGKRL
jgi:Protein kinase domain